MGRDSPTRERCRLRSGFGSCVRIGNLLLAIAIASSVAASPRAAHGEAVSSRGVVHLLEHGAVCDGATDNAPAIARALRQAKSSGAVLLIPVGVCAFGSVIRLDGVTMAGSGEGSVLHALDWRRSAIFMSGRSPVIARLKLTGTPAPSRQAAWEMTKITVFGATDFVIDSVVIDGSPAAGIQTARGATRGRITRNVVRNTLADGIHLTGGASHLLVEGNLVEGSGDDGIAVVSYRNEHVRVSHVVARDNVVRSNRYGRNMSVVGGSQVRLENNLLQDNLAGLACLYIAQEGGHLPTRGTSDVQAVRNTLQGCGGARHNHAAAMIFSTGGEVNERILLLENDIRQPSQAGIRVAGPFNREVRLESNRIVGTARKLDVRSASVSVRPYADGPVGYLAR